MENNSTTPETQAQIEQRSKIEDQTCYMLAAIILDTMEANFDKAMRSAWARSVAKFFNIEECGAMGQSFDFERSLDDLTHSDELIEAHVHAVDNCTIGVLFFAEDRDLRAYVSLDGTYHVADVVACDTGE